MPLESQQHGNTTTAEHDSTTTDGSDATAATADTADFFQTLIQVARNEQLFKFKKL